MCAGIDLNNFLTTYNNVVGANQAVVVDQAWGNCQEPDMTSSLITLVTDFEKDADTYPSPNNLNTIFSNWSTISIHMAYMGKKYFQNI
jgi:hypothetical protein